MLLSAAPDHTGASSMILTHERRRSLILTLSAGFLLAPLRAAAQQTPGASPPSAAEQAPETTVPARVAPAEPPPSAAAAPSTRAPAKLPPSAAGAPSTSAPATLPPSAAETALLERRVEAVEKRLDLLAPLKITGFVQAQYTRNDTSNDSVDSNGKPVNKNMFDVRRARLRATYTLGFAEAVVNLDAIPTGVTVKEAETSATIAWARGFTTKLTAGLFYTPWGYETQESDSVLGFVERSTFTNRLFPGQRELGLRAWSELFDQRLVFQVALANGTTLNDAVFPALDPNNAKDVVGRLGVRLGGLRVGISGLAGTGYLPALADDPKTTDVNEAHGLRNFARRAAGFDVVFTQALPVIGELALYAEGVLAHDLDRSRLQDYPKVATVTNDGVKSASNGLVHSNQAAGYVGLLQHFTQWAAAGVRGEVFDPSTKLDKNSIYGLLFVAHVYPHPAMRLTAGYQIYYETPKLKNNVLTLRAQVKW
jgi:hypothetical protein